MEIDKDIEESSVNPLKREQEIGNTHSSGKHSSGNSLNN